MPAVDPHDPRARSMWLGAVLSSAWSLLLIVIVGVALHSIGFVIVALVLMGVGGGLGIVVACHALGVYPGWRLPPKPPEHEVH